MMSKVMWKLVLLGAPLPLSPFLGAFAPIAP